MEAPKDKNFKKHFIGEKGWKFRSICEVLREIYWETEDQVIREKVKEAMFMAKKMGGKLIEYKGNYYDQMEYDAIAEPEEVVKARRAKYEDEIRRDIEHELTLDLKDD